MSEFTDRAAVRMGVLEAIQSVDRVTEYASEEDAELHSDLDMALTFLLRARHRMDRLDMERQGWLS